MRQELSRIGALCALISSRGPMVEPRTLAADKPVRAPRGPALSCKGWPQEAALRMLMNSLDPAVAEHPEELIVSAAVGTLPRDWQAVDALVKSLQTDEEDEPLLLPSGAP